MRKIFCVKLKQEATGLDFLPYHGTLGQKIYDSISAEAWDQWLSHQTLLINENRLSMQDTAARQFLETEMERFLFSESKPTQPEGYTDPT